MCWKLSGVSFLGPFLDRTRAPKDPYLGAHWKWGSEELVREGAEIAEDKALTDANRHQFRAHGQSLTLFSFSAGGFWLKGPKNLAPNCLGAHSEVKQCPANLQYRSSSDAIPSTLSGAFDPKSNHMQVNFRTDFVSSSAPCLTCLGRVSKRSRP